MHPGLAEPRTKEEWRDYLLTAPPPQPHLPTHATYQKLSNSDRQHLNQTREDYHSALVIVRTAAMQHIHRAISRKLRTNTHQPAGARRGIVIDGPPTVGKSTLVKVFAADLELRLRATHPHPQHSEGHLCDHVPVVYISIPSQATPKDLSIAIAEWLNQPFRSHATKTEITNLVLRALRLCRTQLVIIDDVHFLDLSAKEGKVVNDHLKYLANHCPATFVYTGHDLERSGLFLEGTGTDRATQTSGRNALHKLHPFTIDTPDQIREWAAVIKTMEDALALYKHTPGTLATKHWKHLHDRTGGSIASLSELIREAAIHAVDTHQEAITRPLLDDIIIDARATKSYQLTRKRKNTHNTTTSPATTIASA